MANEKYMRELRKKKQKDTGAPMPGSTPVSQANAPSAQSMGGGLTDEQKFYIKQGQGTSRVHDFNQGNVPPSMRRGSERQQGRETFDTRSVSDIGGKAGLLTQLERGKSPVSDKADAARQTQLRQAKEKRAVTQASEDMLYQLPHPTSAAGKGDPDSLTKRLEAFGDPKKVAAQDKVVAGKVAKKELEDIYGQFGMEYEEGGQVKAKVMSMLDGMKDMPAEAEVVKMIVEKHGVSEDEAKAMIAEYKQSKMGMGGKMEYEGGGAMKMMRDPKDMVGMAMGGAKIIS